MRETSLIPKNSYIKKDDDMLSFFDVNGCSLNNGRCCID